MTLREDVWPDKKVHGMRVLQEESEDYALGADQLFDAGHDLPQAAPA